MDDDRRRARDGNGRDQQTNGLLHDKLRGMLGAGSVLPATTAIGRIRQRRIRHHVRRLVRRDKRDQQPPADDWYREVPPPPILADWVLAMWEIHLPARV